MDKTRTVGKKWLANELDLHFLTLKKCTKNQFNRSILSKVIVLTNYKLTNYKTQTDRQICEKKFFRVQRVSKRGHLTKTGGGGCHILHKSNTFSDENVKMCFRYEEDGRTLSLTVDALISDIWLEEWGGTSDGYIGILATCSFPSSKIIQPISVHVGPIPCYEDPSHSLVIASIEKINPTIRRQFTLCIKGLDFEDDVSEKLIAFVELHRILGASFFHFYVFDVHENVLKVLRLYERSNVVRWHNLTLPGDLPSDKEGRRMLFEKDVWIKRRMELIPYNHCLYENLHKSEFVVPLDMDETIVPLRRKNWSQLLLDEKIKLGKSFKDYASYAVRNVYFFPEIQNKNGSLKNGMENVDYLDSIRTSIISPEGDSIKSFVSTKRTLTVHNHYALSTLNPAVKRTHHFNSKDVLKHHHRVCDERHLDCDLLMEDVRVDNSALRYAEELRARIKIARSNLEKIE